MTSARCLLVAALGLAACDASEPTFLVPPGDGLAVRLDRAAYAPEASVRLTLANETDRAVELAMPLVLGCSVELERELDDVWARVPLDPTPMCAAAPVRLAGGATLVETVWLHARAPGTYRYEITIEPGRQTAVSPPFAVRSPIGA